MGGDSAYIALKGAEVDMEEIAQNIQILPEKTLQDIAKGPLVKFTQSCDNSEYEAYNTHCQIVRLLTPS